MSYTKNTWQSGDIITKEKLDNMEDGIYDAYKLPEKKYFRLTTGSNVTVSANNGKSLSTSANTLVEDTYNSTITYADILSAGSKALILLAGIDTDSLGLALGSYYVYDDPFAFDCRILNVTGSDISKTINIDFLIYIFE